MAEHFLYGQRGYDKIGMNDLARYSVRSTGASVYLVLPSDYLIRSTNTTVQAIGLPTAVGIEGRVYVIKKIGATGNVVIAPVGSETIDGSTTKILSTQYEVIHLMSDGANWLTF